MNEIPTPITRKEQYLAKAAGDNSVAVPDPITREEQYLNAIAQGGGGSSLPDVTSDDNGDVLTVVDGAWAKAAPSGGEAFVITISFDDDLQKYVSDKTQAEIETALSAGSEIKICATGTAYGDYTAPALVQTSEDGDHWRLWLQYWTIEPYSEDEADISFEEFSVGINQLTDEFYVAYRNSYTSVHYTETIN